MSAKPDVRVVFCPVGHPPEVRIISPVSDELEKLVGGRTIDCRRLPVEAIDLWCNDEAIPEGMPPNRNVPGLGFVHGPFVLAISTDEGDLDSLTEERAAELVALAESWPVLPGSYPGRGRGPS